MHQDPSSLGAGEVVGSQHLGPFARFASLVGHLAEREAIAAALWGWKKAMLGFLDLPYMLTFTLVV